MTDKKILNISVRLPLAARIEKAAKIAGETPADFIIGAIQRATKHTELSSRDYAQIAKTVAA